MFGMVAATGIRILSGVDFKTNRNNAMRGGLDRHRHGAADRAPRKQWMPHSVHPLVESGILLSSVTAVLLNLNGAQHDERAVIAAASQED